MHNFQIKNLVLLCVVGLSGCSLAPDYQQPKMPVPSIYAEGGGVQAGPMPDWRNFISDNQLRELVGRALEHNRDLRIALLNIESARAQYGISRADRLPAVNATGAFSREDTPALQRPPGAPAGPQSMYRAELGLSAFEIDLFSRTRNLSESALQEYLATEEAARNVRITLISRVSEAYLDYASAGSRLALTQKVLTSRERAFSLAKLRFGAGTASELDVLEAQGLLEEARTESVRSARTLSQARNALRLLVGEDNLSTSLGSAPAGGQLFGDVRAGLPSDLLTQRPDIMAAEHGIRARNADIGAARAAFFPRITLTGALGTAGPELSGLFSGDTRTWQFMPQITLPIFAGGRNRANLDLANVRKDTAVAEYEKTIQTAFTEVSDALNARTSFDKELMARQKQVTSSDRTLALAELRYRTGLDSHLRYLDAQRQNFTGHLNMLDSWRNSQASRIQLYKALGGSQSLEGMAAR
ncbi:efflux transporter outer membrane subunit [Pectobacterium jejuense]|uniref:efflux transporter outer membrane subunit n=1 Tax=Pectobacterium TaxID=122277 RepID=UPI00227F3E29|nr:efflux transporter outer membrane subunit [Pectobacterium jejuense]MCY9848894.1 efflux transporter outer membrane subunit [Pectobacterium jejuense]